MATKEKEVTEMTPGAIYLSHIPHGFYEREMRSYFSQFGEVTNVKLFRSFKVKDISYITFDQKQTGRSRGFAFIVFSCSEVAKIVSDTHNNYLLFDKLMKCRYVDPDTLSWKILRPFRLRKRKPVSKPKTQEEVNKCIRGTLRRETKRRKRLKDLGINYEFPGYSSCIKSKEHLLKKSKHTIFIENDEEQ